MVVALLLSLTATVITDLVTYGSDKKARPSAPLYTAEPIGGAVLSRMVKQATAEERERFGTSDREGADHRKKAVRELHELLANLTLLLVLLHIARVALVSIVHRENLVAAMVTGPSALETRPPKYDAALGVAAKSGANPVRRLDAIVSCVVISAGLGDFPSLCRLQPTDGTR
jgi:cytochrome b